MKKYGLELQDFFDGLHPAMTKVVEQSLDRSAAAAFTEIESAERTPSTSLAKRFGKQTPRLAIRLNELAKR
jgi:hypothetical protein